mmetsp:Transcript_2667/g.3998  ORF Transcript_2667/g.3998 Transcript_2667/m.3998 type:complete len:115 (+) Transcript_2667:102-446(+)
MQLKFLFLITIVSYSITYAEHVSESIQDNPSHIEPILELPPPSDDSSSTKQFKIGETVSMDEFGPIIVNPDGTLRRIANWDQLTEGEKERTRQQISKRNKKRLASLNNTGTSSE